MGTHSAMKKKQPISDFNSHIRRSKRIEDTIDPSPSCSHRNNWENNSASQLQQQKKQRPRSSNTVDNKPSTRANGRLKKDPAQPTCKDWIQKSKKQGMILDDNSDNDEEFEFDDTFEKSSSKLNYCSFADSPLVDQKSLTHLPLRRPASCNHCVQKNGAILPPLADPAPVLGVAHVSKEPRERDPTT